MIRAAIALLAALGIAGIWYTEAVHAGNIAPTPQRAYTLTGRCLHHHGVKVSIEKDGSHVAHFGRLTGRFPARVEWWYSYQGSGITLTPITWKLFHDTTRAQRRIFNRCLVRI